VDYRAKQLRNAGKEVRGFRRFSLRGRKLVSEEWQLICLTHNLLKLFRSGAQLVPA